MASVAHEITYTNTGQVTVSDVAASLMANERLLRDTAQLLEDLYPGLRAELSVNFRSATTASPLKEYFILGLIMVYQKNLTEEVPPFIEQMIGREIPESMETTVTLLFMAVAIFGISKAFEIFKTQRTGEPVPPSIQGDFNTILNVAGDVIGVDPAVIVTTLEKRHAGRKAVPLAKRALQFIRPAKVEPGAGVVGGGTELSPETVRAAPGAADVEASEDMEDQEPLLAQQVVIHATDLDSKKTGWACHLPGRWGKRLRMQLFPSVDASAIYGRREITADVILMSKADDEGDLIPYLAIITRLHSPKVSSKKRS